MKRFEAMHLGLALAALGAGHAAEAAVVTRTFDLVGRNFTQPFGGMGLPAVAQVKLNFTVSYDPIAVQNPTTENFKVNSFNLPYALKWAYVSGVMTVATQAGLASCGNPPNSFCAFIVFPGGQARELNFLSQSNADGVFFVANERELTITDGPSAVPEPATWALMLAGFGAAGLVLRRRTKVSVAFA